MQIASDGLTVVVREIGPWIISGLALVQVWVIAGWRKLRRGAVEIHGSGTIEVGHSSFGPTIGIHGTLEGLDKSVFVERLYVQVLRKKDGARHTLGWRAIRPLTLKLSGDPIDEIELPSSFLLRPEEPYRFSVLFNDSAFVADVGPSVNPVADLWYQFKEDQLAELAQEHGNLLTALNTVDALDESLYKEFTKTPEVGAAWAALSHAFYWSPGDYEVTMVVQCRRPNQEFTTDWVISLTDEDSEQLRLNTVSIIRGVCGLPTHFRFATTPALPGPSS